MIRARITTAGDVNRLSLTAVRIPFSRLQLPHIAPRLPVRSDADASENHMPPAEAAGRGSDQHEVAQQPSTPSRLESRNLGHNSYDRIPAFQSKHLALGPSRSEPVLRCQPAIDTEAFHPSVAARDSPYCTPNMDRTARSQRIQELDAERALLERRFDEVSRELEDLRGALRENDIKKAACAPVHMLPDDVLKLVLEEACDHSRREDCYRSDAHTALDVLDVSQVSRRWRDVVLSLPRLWRCIHVIAQSSDLLALFVERARSAPVSIVCNTPDMYMQHGHGWWVEPYLKNMLFVWQYAHLFDSLTVRSEDSSFFETLLPTMEALSLPLLRSLRLWWYDDDDEEPWFPNTIPFRPDCPKLEYFRATWIPVPSSTPSFERLTTFNISGIYDARMEDLVALANTAPQLKHIVLDCNVAIEEIIGDLRPARFPFVQSLSIIECDDVFQLLDCLDLPTLQILVIGRSCTTLYDVRHPPPPPRPYSTVHTLYIEHQVWTIPEEQSYLFQYVPEITTLEFHGWRGDSTIFSTNLALQVCTQEASLPRLRTLVLTGAYTLPNNLRMIIERRAQQSCPLTELQVGSPTWEDTSSEERELLQRCINVKIIPDAPCIEIYHIVHKY
ncbi:hypothetical protein PsYK624_025610 [Phanerochaete sordida]|uniref:F-box domain-containing protein n=1 Tax=Phanerochaete sordida TaxID=48140 RepID=A0A9P3G1E7_9APHY|nr:hypothetical protein PsYK624_025610 [Phanerochaete sordida]